jgi:hypothetical protein
MKGITEDACSKSLKKIVIEEEIAKIIKNNESNTHEIEQIEFVQAPRDNKEV